MDPRVDLFQAAEDLARVLTLLERIFKDLIG